MIQKSFRLAFILVIIATISVSLARAAGSSLTGQIVTTDPQSGNFWYVDPVSGWRMELATPLDLHNLIARVGVKVKATDLKKIPRVGSQDIGNAAAQKRWAGMFLRDTDHKLAAWYVSPVTLTRYRLYDATSGLALLESLGTQITTDQFDALPHDLGIAEVTKSVATERGTFTVTMLAFDRTTPGLKLMTDTAQINDCRNNCLAFPLATYVRNHQAQAGIHGAYACPPDYGFCASKTNSYLTPVFNSFRGVLVNNHRVKYTVQPMVVFDTNNKAYYFHQAKEFKNQATFEAKYGVKMRAAMSNGPAIVENGKNVLRADEMDQKQATAHGYRGFIAWQGDMMYLGLVHGATVTDEAATLTAMGVDGALNLDGGGSTALYHGGRYLLGPGRLLTNVILVTS